MVLAGADCGGSTCRLSLRLEGEDETLCTVVGPPGNATSQSPLEVATTIHELLGKALTRSKLPCDIAGFLVVGAAGCGEAAVASEVESYFAALRPNWTVTVVTDGTIALHAAFGMQPGLVLVAGTGSVVLARTEAGSVVGLGGWGPLAGDLGAGHWLGRHLLAHLARVFDGIEEEGISSEDACRVHGLASREDFKAWLRMHSRRGRAMGASVVCSRRCLFV